MTCRNCENLISGRYLSDKKRSHRNNSLLWRVDCLCICLSRLSFSRSVLPLCGLTRIEGMKKPLVRVFREVVRITLLETRREEVPMHFLCTVSPNLKLLTFLEATALQRKLSFGALDFSPLRHSPALTGREYYTKKIRPRGRRRFTAAGRAKLTGRRSRAGPRA